jgi:hypothetical protein
MAGYQSPFAKTEARQKAAKEKAAKSGKKPIGIIPGEKAEGMGSAAADYLLNMFSKKSDK